MMTTGRFADHPLPSSVGNCWTQFSFGSSGLGVKCDLSFKSYFDADLWPPAKEQQWLIRDDANHPTRWTEQTADHSSLVTNLLTSHN